MTDELSAPLGRKRRRSDRRQGAGWTAWPWGRIGVVVVVLAILGVAGWIVLVDDPLGGRPVAEAPINLEPAPNPIVNDLVPAPQPQRDAPADGPSIITLGDRPMPGDGIAELAPAATRSDE